MNLLIDPKAEPIGHRPPYRPIEVSGRKVVRPVPPTPVMIGFDFGRESTFGVWTYATGIDTSGYTAMLRKRNLL